MANLVPWEGGAVGGLGPSVQGIPRKPIWDFLADTAKGVQGIAKALSATGIPPIAGLGDLGQMALASTPETFDKYSYGLEPQKAQGAFPRINERTFDVAGLAANFLPTKALAGAVGAVGAMVGGIKSIKPKDPGPVYTQVKKALLDIGLGEHTAENLAKPIIKNKDFSSAADAIKLLDEPPVADPMALETLKLFVDTYSTPAPKPPKPKTAGIVLKEEDLQALIENNWQNPGVTGDTLTAAGFSTDDAQAVLNGIKKKKESQKWIEEQIGGLQANLASGDAKLVNGGKLLPEPLPDGTAITYPDGSKMMLVPDPTGEVKGFKWQAVLPDGTKGDPYWTFSVAQESIAKNMPKAANVFDDVAELEKLSTEPKPKIDAGFTDVGKWMPAEGLSDPWATGATYKGYKVLQKYDNGDFYLFGPAGEKLGKFPPGAADDVMLAAAAHDAGQGPSGASPFPLPSPGYESSTLAQHSKDALKSLHDLTDADLAILHKYKPEMTWKQWLDEYDAARQAGYERYGLPEDNSIAQRRKFMGAGMEEREITRGSSRANPYPIPPSEMPKKPVHNTTGWDHPLLFMADKESGSGYADQYAHVLPLSLLEDPAKLFDRDLIRNDPYGPLAQQFKTTYEHLQKLEKEGHRKFPKNFQAYTHKSPTGDKIFYSADKHLNRYRESGTSGFDVEDPDVVLTLREMGLRGIVTHEAGGRNYGIMDTAKVRYKNAPFNPDKRHLKDLFATAAAMGVSVPALLEILSAPPANEQ